ncbi:MAG: purine-binding chemotaxis protein CheW [Armatimonadetes bacterium]|nr:purine-binding chemotaxis protein CheW [Armatimonadota bacterium]
MAENKYIVFELADEFYGIPIESVERILSEQKPTRLPKTAEMFLGVFDLRGETIPAIDLRIRFDMPKWDKESNFIVVLTKLGRCALKVDGIDGIVTLQDEDVDATAEIMKHEDDDFICGVGKDGERLIVLINPDHVVPTDLRNQVQAAADRKPEAVA